MKATQLVNSYEKAGYGDLLRKKKKELSSRNRYGNKFFIVLNIPHYFSSHSMHEDFPAQSRLKFTGVV